jgi:hypothetical protein
MKYFLQHPDVTGRYDPPGVDSIRQTPGRVETVEEADVIFVPVARFDGFRFDDKLNDITKPWVLFDWCEFGWDWDMKRSFLWGEGRMSHRSFQNEEWEKFNRFVKDHPPILTFQRELLAKHVTGRILPLDYLNWLPEVGNDPPEDFAKRPLAVEYDWGRSHEGRMILHGAIFQSAARWGYDVISEYAHVDRALQDEGRKWLSVHAPHYDRLDVRELQKLIRKSTMTIIMPGAGQKTFRLGERCADAIMAIPKHKLACAYPWDVSNSIPIPQITKVEHALEACDILNLALHRQDLYQLYGNAMSNALNYRPENYCRRWIAGNVEKCL